MYRAWWHYIGDLDAAVVSEAIDRAATSGVTRAPSPADVRRRAIDIADPKGAFPTESQCLRDAIDLANASQMGVPTQENYHPMVIEVVKRAPTLSEFSLKKAYLEALEALSWERYRPAVDPKP
jgi:hypothetical protein